jgi:hypothetical protein
MLYDKILYVLNHIESGYFENFGKRGNFGQILSLAPSPQPTTKNLNRMSIYLLKAKGDVNYCKSVSIISVSYPILNFFNSIYQ